MYASIIEISKMIFMSRTHICDWSW